MQLVLVGLSHHAAPIAVRERVTCTEHRLPHALEHAASCAGIREIVILSTCNRIEQYALIDDHDPEEAFATICRHLSSFHNVPEAQFRSFMYLKTERDAVAHLLRVAAGLDSLVLGESQILGQVRTSLRAASAVGAAGGVLSHLFQHALNSGKRVRQETGLGRGAFSIGHAAVDLASRIFDLPDAAVLILGAGKMSLLTARHLAASGVRVIFVANRTHDKAVALAKELKGEAIGYDEFPAQLATADIVIASTAAPHPIIRREMLLEPLRRRRGKPLFLIDIAVPRDVDEDVADLDNVFLYNIDHLQEVVSDRIKGRESEAHLAESIVNAEAEKFLAWYHARGAAPVIRQIKSSLDSLARKRLSILKSGLGTVSERDWSLIESQVASLMDEVAREPILRLKRASEDASGVDASKADRYDLLTAAAEIFGLDTPRNGGQVPEEEEKTQ